jgi:hypothetical protein
MKIKIGLTYDLRSEYLTQGYSELETAEFDREDTVPRSKKPSVPWGMSPSGSATPNSLSLTSPPAVAGTWSSTLPKACTASGGKPRCRPFWTCTRFPTPFLTPSS